MSSPTSDSPDVVSESHEVESAAVSSSGADLQSMAKTLVASRIGHLKDKVAEEVKDLKERHQRIRLMHRMLRAINDTKQENGGIDFSKSPELQEMRKQAKELSEQADKLLAEADKLEKEGKVQEAKELRDEASELKDVAKAMGADASKNTYTKEEKEKLVENLRMTSEDIQTLNQLQTQTVSRLNNELHESLLIGRDIIKKVHEILSLMSRGIRGG